MAAKGIFVYIDCSNITKSVHVLWYKDLDWAALINWLRTRQKAARVYIYASYIDAAEKAYYENYKSMVIKWTLKRSNTRVKDLQNKGIIKINALEAILGFKGYGIK